MPVTLSAAGPGGAVQVAGEQEDPAPGSVRVSISASR
jgi:hypothetical protein